MGQHGASFFLPRLRERLALGGLAPRTVDRYASIVERAEHWCADRKVPLRHAGAAVVVELCDTWPNSHATRTQVRAALGWYWRETGRQSPPLGAIRVPKRQRMVCRALDEEDAKLLAKAARARGDAKGLVVLLSLYAALRRFEIAELRWDQIHEGWLTLVGKYNQTAAIPVHPELMAALEAMPRRSPWLFPGRLGGHVHPATVWNWHKEVAEAAGVGEVAPHIGRHTALATANDNTGDLRATMEFARHVKPTTTVGYTRTTARRLVEVVNALNY